VLYTIQKKDAPKCAIPFFLATHKCVLPKEGRLRVSAAKRKVIAHCCAALKASKSKVVADLWQHTNCGRVLPKKK